MTAAAVAAPVSPLTDALRRAPTEEALIALLRQAQVGPGWAKKKPSVYPEPHRLFAPAHWRRDEARAALDAAKRFVSTDLAERRNLILVNPHEGNDYATARTLVAAYQLVCGRERARSHRHSPNALRLVLDAAPGTYTIVEGQRIPMARGDIVLTPRGCWHGHSNESDEDAFWIDFLDVPLIHLLGPMFFEQHPDWMEQAGPSDPASPMRFPYAVTGPALRAMPESRPGERRLELGPPAMSTIGLSLRHLSKDRAVEDRRTTESRIHAVIEGAGSMSAEGQTFSFSAGDVLVVPDWTPAIWRCSADTVLLSVSDRPVLQSLGLLRSEAEA